jgi:hypothetical protein
LKIEFQKKPTFIFSASMAAYFMGCHIRKAPPKQAENVASGSVTPISVPALKKEEQVKDCGMFRRQYGC